MDKTTAYLQILAACFPDLPIETVTRSGAGQYNDVLLLNESLIFRFPKYAEGIQTLQNEVWILKSLQGHTRRPVPNPIYVHEGGPVGEVFMGYPKLPGEPLWRESLKTIEDETVIQRLAAQLAHFLVDLHQFPVTLLPADIPVRDSLTGIKEMYAGVRTHLFHHMRAEARQEVQDHFETYLETPALREYTPVLHHGDFGGSNILYDPESQQISGVIDFGFAGLGDPAQDIAAISTYGESFFSQFCQFYPQIEALLPRARFYRGTFALSEALHGALHHDEEAFRAGMAAYL
ncbi:MAG TPA: aminoglycoside phosphotransferase family protein [Anaerolineales bacterium]|nr:aminoglycoside phosphotransferase family protein [Anaerolineales bacterium]